MGQLPGYWLGTADDRPDGPFISAQEWDKRLRQAGFSGADHVLYDYQPPLESTAVIVSHKQGQETELPMKVNGHHASTAKREPVYLVSFVHFLTITDADFGHRSISIRSPTSSWHLRRSTWASDSTLTGYSCTK